MFAPPQRRGARRGSAEKYSNQDITTLLLIGRRRQRDDDCRRYTTWIVRNGEMMKRAVVSALVILFAVTLNSSLSRALLNEPGETETPRLAEQVTIRRDTYGIPHILAKTEEAAAFGLGYAQAEDHGLAIARRLIAARGEAAKYTGQGVEGDLLIRRFDNLEVCRQNFGQLDPLLQRIFNDYAAGFNHYVSKHRQ